MATFFIHIESIVGLCADKKMGPIAASGVVAGMTHACITGIVAYLYRPIVQLVGDTVGVVSVTMPLEEPITSIFRPLPRPTGIRCARSTVVPEGFFQRGAIGAVVMSWEKTPRSASDITLFCMSLWRDACLLPATALAQSAWIRFVPIGVDNRSLVSADKTNGFTFDPSIFCPSELGKRSFPATTALAVAVGDFVKLELGLGKLWSMLSHVSLLVRLTMPGAVTSSALALLLRLCKEIIAHLVCDARVLTV